MPKGNGRALEDYISEYIKSDEAKKIICCTEKINGQGFDSWSFKKLIFLEYYLKPYLNIVKKNGYKCYYIDLYAGAGASRLKDKNAKTIGSPVISLLKGIRRLKNSDLRRFDKWFFAEKSEEHFDALEKRVSSVIEIIKARNNEKLNIGKDVHLLEGDCNSLIDDIVKIIKEDSGGANVSILAFVDPYNLSHFKWDTLKKISEFSHVDVIFNLPTGAYKRNKYIYKELEKHLPDLTKNEKARLYQTDDGKFFSSMFAKGISKVAKCNIYYYDNGVIVKNRTNTELFRISLFTRSSPGAGIVSGIIGKLNKFRTKDIDKEIQKITGKISPLNQFFCNEKPNV